MKRFMIHASIFLLIATLSLFVFVQCSNVMQPEENVLAVSTDASVQKYGADCRMLGNLTDVEKADLLYLREEEKLARDLYNVFAQTWGTAVFSKIALSEQRHMDALKRMIDKHNMTAIDPVLLQPEPGLFVDENLQALYNEWKAKGELSATDALEVGVLVEEAVIVELGLFLDRVDNQDIVNVYNNLLDGSNKHLVSFQALLPQ